MCRTTHLSANPNPNSQLQYNEVFVLCIGIGLILLTIAFKEGKEYLEDSVTEDMEPIVEKLFGEMTVLGFLSMVTCLVSLSSCRYVCLEWRTKRRNSWKSPRWSISAYFHHGLFL